MNRFAVYPVEKLISFLFMVCLMLIRIPPFYILPSNSNVFSSHSFSKVLLTMLFGCLFIFNKRINWGISKVCFILLLAYFIGQSLSITTTKDVVLFWESYQNVVSFVLIFLLSSYISAQKKIIPRFTKWIVIIGVLLTGLEFIVGIFPDLFITIARDFIQKEVLNAYITNMLRDRYSLEVTLEIFLPFFLFYLFSSTILHKRWRFFMTFMTMMLIYNSIFSNIRSRILMLFVAFLSSLWVYLRSNQQQFTRTNKIVASGFAVIMLVGIFFTATYVSSSLFSFSVINRIFLEDVNEDIGTLNSRIQKVNRSWDLFQISPIFGVGLGNYVYDVKLSYGQAFYTSSNTQSQVAYFETAQELPHNIFSQIFSETGLMGTLPFIAIMIYFAYHDWRRFKTSEWNIYLCYSISSWVIITYAIFNPASTIFIMGWFWFFRGVLEGSTSGLLNRRNSKA